MRLEEIRARTASASTDEMAQREGIVFEVDSVDKLQAIDKAHQANRSVHTLEAWEKRFALRRSKLVREALHEWWLTVLRTISPAFAHMAKLPFLDKASYMRLIVLLCAALNRLEGDEEDEEAALGMALEDWERDARAELFACTRPYTRPHGSQGNNEADDEADDAADDRRIMPRESLLDGIFQIADLYTDSVSALEYSTFLRELLQECSFEAADEDDEGCHVLCADDSGRSCGCADSLCPNPTAEGEEHNRRWAVYELKPAGSGKGKAASKAAGTKAAKKSKK
jgi:hypothetical protein